MHAMAALPLGNQPRHNTSRRSSGWCIIDTLRTWHYVLREWCACHRAQCAFAHETNPCNAPVAKRPTSAPAYEVHRYNNHASHNSSFTEYPDILLTLKMTWSSKMNSMTFDQTPVGRGVRHGQCLHGGKWYMAADESWVDDTVVLDK